MLVVRTQIFKAKKCQNTFGRIQIWTRKDKNGKAY